MSDTRIAFFLWIAAFLARYVLYLGTEIYGTDSAEFLLMARWMGEGRFHDALKVTYHPLYPLLTSALSVFTGDVERAGFWVSMIFGSAAMVPLFFLARSIFGRPAAVVTALLYAVQPHTVELHADVMTEGTFAFFFFSSMWLCWRTIQEPSIERSILTGLAASAAYLTRAEGLLAVVLVTGWPVVFAIRNREGRPLRLSGVGLGMLAALILAFPFLAWVRSEMGTWKVSAKVSVTDAARAVGQGGLREEDLGEKEGKSRWSPRYAKLIQSLGRLTYIVTVPLMLLGLAGLGGHGWRGPLYYFSFPLGYLAGILNSLRSVPYMSYRYVVPVMNLLMVLAGLGFVVLARHLAKRWPEPKATRGALAAVAVMVLVMAVSVLRPHRAEEATFRVAGGWLVEHRRPGETFYTTTDKLAFLAGSGARGFPLALKDFQAEVVKSPAAYYVFMEKDLDDRRRSYVDWLHVTGRVGEPVVLAGVRPGAWSVTIYPAR
jgi:4-amino-4-deoxy-L-arabinose transferase-like glycosyltransferase